MATELIKINCLLAKLTKSKQYIKTLQLFQQVQSSHYLKPDQYTLSTTLTAAANRRDVAAGNQVHAIVIRTGFKPYPHVANTLLFLYSKSMDLGSVKRVFREIKNPDVYSWTTLLSACTNLGDVDYALQVFDEIPQRNEAVWNAVITGCADNNHSDIALGMFQRMHLLGIKHDNYSFASVLSSCSSDLIDFGEAVQSLVIKTGFSGRSSVKNALITMYFNFGDANQAFDVFEETEETVRDQITYNAMIAGFVSLGRDDEAFMMFKTMRKSGHRPTERTFVSVMSSCSCSKTAEQLHSDAIKTGFEDFNPVSNAAITMYSASGDLNNASVVFERLIEKDRVSWNTMITIYAQENCSRDAVSVYLQMQREGIEPDEFTIGSLLATLDSTENVEMILGIVIKRDLVSKPETRCIGRCVCYLYRNALQESDIVEFNDFRVSLKRVFGDRIKTILRDGCIGFNPDVYTLNIVLTICAGILAFRNGKEIHGYVLKFRYFHEPSLGNALIALYAKCGILDWSVNVFESMVYKDVVSWNSMISAYGNHGRGEDAVRCFEEMQKTTGGMVKVEPDHTTFTAALTACSHAGLVDHGVEIFNSMVNRYGLEPGIDHFSCIVDLLGRAGHLDAAEILMKSGRFNVHCSVWWNLFSSCAAHGDLRLGRIVAGFLLESEEDKSSVYVVLSNILANAGYWEEAADTRKMMRSYGVVKQPGYSWIRS
ncbi:hypothetical protein OSB04_007551 [Centaurea solstitialis]|uniref:Pentatricopeptide repeat-containing protein n=1 Tax=Centaurea solstitialis TaxID=347529 RepID=A0AA38TVL1_9ASTR|nr:hypothetical protein OSB04_007551 [Centaurea solstitialis]